MSRDLSDTHLCSRGNNMLAVDVDQDLLVSGHQTITKLSRLCTIWFNFVVLSCNFLSIQEVGL